MLFPIRTGDLLVRHTSLLLSGVFSDVCPTNILCAGRQKATQHNKPSWACLWLQGQTGHAVSL